MSFLINGKVFETIKQSKKFFSRQAKQIEAYGEKKMVARLGVSDEMINVFTPFRRTSNKPCTLSDNKWFIERFENTRGTEYLPSNWSELTDADKIDYIVKDRYSSLVANKIMNTIKDEPIEHGFGINKNGEIVFHDFGNSNKLEIKQFSDYENFRQKVKAAGIEDKVDCADLKIHVHNHPSFVGMDIDAINEVGSAFSGNDMYNFMLFDCQGRVVDSVGHKFSFIPKTKRVKDHSFAESAQRYFDYIWRDVIFARKECLEINKKLEQMGNQYETLINTRHYDLEQAKILKKEMDNLYKQLTIASKPLALQKELFGKDETIVKYFGKWDCIA